MPDINLLPDDLREKEGKEIESAKKKPRVFRIDMSQPAKEKMAVPFKTPPKPSIFGRLFSRKAKSAKPSFTKEKEMPEFEEEKTPKSRVADKVLHLPESREEKSNISASDKPSVLSKLFAQEAKPAKKESVVGESKLSQISDLEKEVRAREEEKVFHMPEVAENKGGVDKGKKLDLIKAKGQSQFTFSRLIAFLKRLKIVPGQGLRVLKDSTKSMLDVNLIPKELTKYPELEFPKKLFHGSAVALVSILLVALAYLGMTAYQLRINYQIKSIGEEMVSLNQEIFSYDREMKSALEMQKYLGIIQQLLDNHLYWTKFFTFLEKYTISDVYYANFSMAGTEKLVISAVGKDYESVAKQLVNFQKAPDFIKNVSINNASAVINYEKGKYEGVDFNIDLEFMPEIFLKNR